MLNFAKAVMKLQQQNARQRTKCSSWRTLLQSVSQSVSQYSISKNQRTKCMQHYTNNTSQFSTWIEMTGNKNATNINTITGKVCVRRNSKSLSKQFTFIKTSALLTVASLHHVTVAVRTFSCKSQLWSTQGKRTPSYYSTLTLLPLPFKHLSTTVQS